MGINRAAYIKAAELLRESANGDEALLLIAQELDEKAQQFVPLSPEVSRVKRQNFRGPTPDTLFSPPPDYMIEQWLKDNPGKTLDDYFGLKKTNID